MKWLLTISSLALGLRVAASPAVFLESFWLNRLPTDGVAIWAGGNYQSAGTAGSRVPNSGNGFYLAESAIGQMTAQTAAYPSASADLDAHADSEWRAATSYRYSQLAGVIVPNPAVTWNLVFPGGFNSKEGNTYSGDEESTFFPDRLDESERALRALLRQNPFDTSAARRLVLLSEERMLPLQFSGSLAVAYASRARMLGKNAALGELQALDKARGYHRGACDVLASVLNNPEDALLVEGANPYIYSAVTNEVGRVLDAYVRNLASYAETSLRYFQIRRLADFRDPAQNQSLPQTLLDELDAAEAEIQLRLLLVSSFQGLPVYTFSAAGQVRSLFRDFARLGESIVQGRISFVAGTGGSDPALGYGEYLTAFVPIFSSTQPGQSSFDLAIGLARSFAADAKAMEESAKNAIEDVLNRNYDYRSAQQNLQSQYLGELVELCGYYRLDEQGSPVPDIVFAALPPRSREEIAQTLLEENYPLSADRTGAIYQQWTTIDTALTELDLARQELLNTFGEMEVRRNVEETIAAGQERLTQLVLANGERIAGLQLQRGEVEATAALEIAKIQAESAKKTAQTSGGLGILGATGDLIRSEGLSGWSSLAQSIATVANSWETASAIYQVGDVQARSARQLAEIAAQITRISESERAEMQAQQATETRLRLAEALNSLRLQADSQRIRLSLAAQRVDQERDRLSSMMARVAYLLRQWSRSTTLLAENPALSNDILLERDAETRRAEESFSLAQQWAFLAAQAFAYKDHCPESASTNTLVSTILSTRNATDLVLRLNSIESANIALSIGCQNSVTYKPARFSIRNDFVQANLTEGSGTNVTYLSVEPTLAGADIAASDQGWLEYLQAHVRLNQFGQRVLVLEFSTAVTQSRVNGVQRNPLFECALFGATIFSGTDKNNTLHKGVQVSITTRGFTPPLGASEGYRIQLSQVGVSSIRRQAFGNMRGDPAQAIRFFNFGSAFAANFTASANSLDANPGTDAFNERSPANDRWRLVINSVDSRNNEALLNNLDRLADIELRLSFRGFTDSQAAENCSN